MKKRNLNDKKVRLLGVGLLASSAFLSVTDAQPIVAKEKDNAEESTREAQENVTILSSTKEKTTKNSTEESSTETTISSESSDSKNSLSTEESTTKETTTDSSSDTSESTSSTSESTSDTSESTSSTSESTSDTSESTSDTSESTSSTSESTSSTNESTNSLKPQPPKPEAHSTTPAQSSNGSYNTHRPSTSKGTSAGNTTNSATSSNQTFYVSPNLTTKNFIQAIGEDARSVAGENGLYASVMIAQAILESASGNSALAAAPNYNLFGIKGSYEGASANFLTSEDDGSGNMFTIRSDFRKYPSYKESLEDYVKLIKGGTDTNNAFYKGVWKTNTTSYKDATKYLTGRYATDSSYNAKLNGLIDAYNLTQYDTLNKADASSKKAKKISLNSSLERLEKYDAVQERKNEYVTHIVQKGESLKKISDMYNISTLAILEKNQLDRRMIYIGQKLVIPKQENATTTALKEEVVDRSLDIAQKLSSAIIGKESKTTINSQASNSKKYQVSATRKKTDTTYEVKKGDTLAGISKKTGVSIVSLKEWNELDQYMLTEGQLLILSPTYSLQS